MWYLIEKFGLWTTLLIVLLGSLLLLAIGWNLGMLGA